jgi:hypothetical protein
MESYEVALHVLDNSTQDYITPTSFGALNQGVVSLKLLVKVVNVVFTENNPSIARMTNC